MEYSEVMFFYFFGGFSGFRSLKWASGEKTTYFLILKSLTGPILIKIGTMFYARMFYTMIEDKMNIWIWDWSQVHLTP